MDENRKSGFYPGEPIFDLNGPVKLTKFRVFIYSKMEHKLTKFVEMYVPKAQDLTITKIHLF